MEIEELKRLLRKGILPITLMDDRCYGVPSELVFRAILEIRLESRPKHLNSLNAYF